MVDLYPSKYKLKPNKVITGNIVQMSYNVLTRTLDIRRFPYYCSKNGMICMPHTVIKPGCLKQFHVRDMHAGNKIAYLYYEEDSVHSASTERFFMKRVLSLSGVILNQKRKQSQWHQVFPIGVLGHPMREYEKGKWESAHWHTELVGDKLVELVAQRIYESWKDQPGFKPWTHLGNSDKQEDARAVARRTLRDAKAI